MKQVIYTICVVSVILNIGLITGYVQIGKSEPRLPTISMSDLER